MEKKIRIYSELYKIIYSNMMASGEEMLFKEKTFLSAIGEYGNVADIIRWRKNETEVFLENIYMQLLERTPDKYVLKHWKTNKEKNDQEIQKQIVNSIINSQEFLSKNSYIKNNIYEGAIIKRDSFAIHLKNRIISIFLPIGRKLPKPMKEAIKHWLKLG